MVKNFILFLGACALPWMAQATLSLEEYASMVGEVNPKTRRLQTLNNNGNMMCYTSELTEAFLQECRQPYCTHVLEVGCGYGIKASQIVQTGVFLVANDIEARHLQVMEEAFGKLGGADPHFKNVRYVPGNFAAVDVEQLGPQKYDAILCESVLHFMLPEDLRETLARFYACLNEGGKVYLTNLSPFQIHREEFEANKASGVEWPGIFSEPDWGPVVYNILDEEMLVKELQRVGLKVLMTKYIQKPFLEGAFQYDGRDWLIAIAER